VADASDVPAGAVTQVARDDTTAPRSRAACPLLLRSLTGPCTAGGRLPPVLYPAALRDATRQAEGPESRKAGNGVRNNRPLLTADRRTISRPAAAGRDTPPHNRATATGPSVVTR
jgi:hypothetical protein